MKESPLFNVRNRDESDFYVAEITRLIRGVSSPFSTKKGNLKDGESSLIKHFGEDEARQHAKLLTLIYQEKINANDDVLDWINLPRISGFCLMILLNRPQFQGRYLDPLSMVSSSSLTGYKPKNNDNNEPLNIKLPFNLEDYEDLPDYNMFDTNGEGSNNNLQEDHGEVHLREEFKQKEYIRIEDGSFINSLSTGFGIDTVIPVSNYGSHHSRRQAVLKIFYDLISAHVKCRGENNDYRFFNLDEIILRIKLDWQQVFLNANYSWIEQDNAEQIRWLHHNLMVKDTEFELPWIVTNTESLHDALITYLDLSFLQNLEDTVKKIETLRKAWVRKNGNDNAEDAKNIGLSSKSRTQLKQLSKRQEKSERTVVKELIQKQHSSLIGS